MKFKPELIILVCGAEMRVYGREDCSGGWYSCCFSGN